MTDAGKRIVQTICVILLSVLGALAVGVIFLVMLGKNPAVIYGQLLFSPFQNLGNFGSVIKNAIPLMIIGVGVSFAGKCGVSNLGGDGQFYMGALGMILVSTTVGRYLGFASIFVGMAFGALLGALCGGIAGWFKSYFKVSEIITTLMLNYIVTYFITYLDHGPLMVPGSSIPQTQAIAPYEMIPRMFKGTTASYSIFIALACVLIYWFVIDKTRFGYHLKLVGGSVKAAEYSGVRPDHYYFIVMAVSGAFGALAGVVEICSFQYRLLDGISNSCGFNAILVSLLGQRNPLGILLASVFFASLTVGANVMQVTCAVPVTLVSILKGLMILFILFGLSVKNGFSFLPGKAAAEAGKERTVA